MEKFNAQEIYDVLHKKYKELEEREKQVEQQLKKAQNDVIELEKWLIRINANHELLWDLQEALRLEDSE